MGNDGLENMAEVMGVMSAAAQLTTLCCSLLRVLKNIKEAPLTLQNYGLQLQDLSLLSSSISRNPLLQTGEVETLTQSIHFLISQANLTFVLKKHKIVRVLYFLCNERALLDTLSAVERQKLSLCLSIEQIQSQALYDIRASLQEMSPNEQNIGKKRSSTKKEKLPASTSTSKEDEVKMNTESKTGNPGGDNDNIAPSPAGNPDKQTSRDTQFQGEGSRMSTEAKPSSISGVTSYSGAQFIGTRIDCDASELHHFENSVKIDDIRQESDATQEVGFFGNIRGLVDRNVDLGRLQHNIHNVVLNGSESGGKSVAEQKVGFFLTTGCQEKEYKCHI